MKFLEKYNNNKNIRFDSFKETIKLCLERGFKTIVETGTARGEMKFFFIRNYNWKDGMSTIIFAEYAHNIDGLLHTCDISQNNIKNAKSFTKKFNKNVKFYIDDSINFLKNFKSKIDLLYLDSFDGHDVQRASKHQLEEAKSSIDKLHDKSLILLDDKGAKTIYSLKYFQQKGFKRIFETDFQVLLSK